ncbi:sulfotransferase domain-containing protein [Candidatus Pacearchaeota archaeon]|nr:sulfotransferase domain-containing protein [Candidatus Pacearchaeota archaeon]
MRIDFIGVGFGRSGSKWLANCLYEHPEISIPKFNLHTEINYFPEEYEVMGLKNYIKKFLNCDFEKKVGELSTLVIFEKRSAKLLKKLFPNTKIIIYRRDEKERVRSSRNVAYSYDLVKDTSISKNPVNEINQEDYIRPWIEEFGKNNVFIYDLEKSDKDKQMELNKLFKFLGVLEFTPPSIGIRKNSDYVDKERKQVKTVKYPFIRKVINWIKPRLKKNKKLYYTLKRNLHFDYLFQLVNHNL